jgi:hypothetical protein
MEWVELAMEPPERSLAGDFGLGWIGEHGHEKWRRVSPPVFSDEAR